MGDKQESPVANPCRGKTCILKYLIIASVHYYTCIAHQVHTVDSFEEHIMLGHVKISSSLHSEFMFDTNMESTHHNCCFTVEWL